MATVTLAKPVTPQWTAPIIFTAAMLCVSVATWSLGGPSPARLALFYIAGAFAPCLAAVLVFIFAEVAKLAKQRADNPIPKVFAVLKPKLPMMVFPILVLPIFLAGYTAAKSAILELVGFRYDDIFANIDAAIFGVDPWRLTHAVIGPAGTQIIELIYTPVWVALLVYVPALMALFASRRLSMTFYAASLLTWFIGGFLLAYLMSAAGPIFTEYNGLEWRFAEIKSNLLQMRGIDSAFLTGPAYLLDGMAAEEAYSGGGISAMPSMHIAVCTLYCLAARGTRWFALALAFLAIIFVGSIHSGYHYAIDAPVAALIAWGCWRYAGAVAEKYGTNSVASAETVVLPIAATPT